DLNGDGVTANDWGDWDNGPNNLQNFPVLASAEFGDGSLTITGTLNSTPNTIFTIELFSNRAADPSGYGEGESLLGDISVTTDDQGHITIDTGPHAYEEEGDYQISVAVSSSADGFTDSTSFPITVVDASLTATGAEIQATEGVAWTGVVASFQDEDPHGEVAD